METQPIPTPTEAAVPNYALPQEPAPERHSPWCRDLIDRRTRGHRIADWTAAALLGVLLALAGALGGLAYAQHAVDTYQADRARQARANFIATAYVSRALVASPTREYARGGYAFMQDDGSAQVRVETADDTASWTGYVVVDVAADGTVTSAVRHQAAAKDHEPYKSGTAPTLTEGESAK